VLACIVLLTAIAITPELKTCYTSLEKCMSIRQTVEFTSVTDIGFAFFKKKSVADASRKLSIFYIFFLHFLFSHSLYFSFS